MKLDGYSEIWIVEVKVHAPPGERLNPICMVAKEILTGRILRLDEETLARSGMVPFDVGLSSLVVAYHAEQVLGCFLALGWTEPVNVVDLHVEFRNETNGLQTRFGQDLAGALLWHGGAFAKAIESAEVNRMMEGGGPCSSEHRIALLKDCVTKIELIQYLWNVMRPRLDARSLLRGSYMMAVAQMEWIGIPMDHSLLRMLQHHWDEFQSKVRRAIDPRQTLWVAGRFDERAFLQWTEVRGIIWPRLTSGFLDLSNDTFSEMATLFPRPLKQVYLAKQVLDQTKGIVLPVGCDGRNRTSLGAFSSRSGRNQPSNTRFAFGVSSWVRRFIQPEAGTALAYVDWSQQEFGIGAALSGDTAMLEAYTSSDPYLAFAKLVGAVPLDATKHSHPGEREIYKLVVLGVGYCLGAEGLARWLSITRTEAEDLLLLHRRCYPDFWKWSDAACDYGQLAGRMHTRFGWQLQVTADTKLGSLRNFPNQANGAEMMRLTAIYASRAGVRLCAPVHDAFLIEAPLGAIDQQVALLRKCMNRASAEVLDGFVLLTEADIFPYPNRVGHGAASPIWDLVLRLMI